jgi:hypothetical protein
MGNKAANRHRGNGRPSSPATPPYVRVRIRRFRKFTQIGWRFASSFAARASPLDRLPFRLHRLLNLASSAEADWLAHGHP